MAEGTTLLLGALEMASDRQLDGPCALPGWSGRHLVAHLALNAEALMNLARWARTGVETPMYSSMAQRDADIEAGSRLPAAELRDRVVETAVALDATLAGLTAEQWGNPVRTAQGRAVSGEEIPWMRSREVMVHAVDLGTGVRFGDLPTDFLASLVDDIVAKRAGEKLGLVIVAEDHGGRWEIPGAGTTEVPGAETTEVPGAGTTEVARAGTTEVVAPLSELAAYLAGRESTLGAQPVLPRWL
ncbi:maleylpyruvate isomerase N-terminal domain-containing protein [Actinoplanes sp. CA-030573]|uniref:maleylpyruvate isomerase N-terminal domain-containing protein n=1 Tax=Actinoplanes sp. CA-030573 TaxID=3239898 RepID=UPI003D8FC01D